MNQAFSKYAIWIILLVGAVLRLYNLHELPYTHDELSALNRLNFSSLSALLWEGIAVDGHPAGVQVFLWFWTSMFGEAEWVVKLPFVISGIASIFVLFKVGEMWFSKNAGLMAAAALATLQYPITYSQVARPYATGLLLVLLLVWAWSSVYIRKDKSVINYILMAVLFAGCAYNHYFSFLTAIIIGCSSILFWKSIDWRFIGVSIVGAAVLFLPHTSVTLNQLSLRGVKWIGPPDSYFFQEFFSYLFHYSNYVGLLFIIVFLLGIVRRLDFNREDILKRVILLIWFLLPCVIGYFYSLHVSPVLQFSVLIFSFPFFLLLMFSWCGNIASPLFTILLFLTLTVNGISLIIERDHYTIFYDQPYKAFDKFYFENRDIPMIYKGNPDYFNRYLAEDWSHVYDYGSLGDVRGMMNFIKAIDAPQIGVVNLPLPWRAAIMQEYPEVVYKKEGLGHEYFILGKTSETPKDDPRVSGLGSLTIAMDSSINSRHYIMEVRSDNPGLPLGGSFYFEIIRDDKILEEHIIPFNRYWTDNNQKIQSYASLRLSDIFKKKTWMDGSVVKITCRDPNQYLLDNYWFEVSVKPSNPLMYGMFERLD